MWDWIGFAWNWVQGLFSTIWEWFIWLYTNVRGFVHWTIQVFENAFGWIATGFRWVIRHLEALRHLNFRSIWNAIKRGYERLRRALDWYMRNVQRPLDKMRQRILEIYRRFFQPIIRFLDSLRVFTRFIALFNRKLAAKLDARLWSLESKILWPITQALKRINSISSQIRAYFTALGFLDRVLLLESMRRDALLVWEVITNPRGRIFDKPAPPPTFSLREAYDNLTTYLQTGGGPLAPRVDEMREHFREALLELE